MTSLELVIRHLESWPRPREVAGFVVVPTFGLYPSGALIQAFIETGSGSAQVSDGGGAFDEIVRAGDFNFNAMASLKAFGIRAGLRVDERGWILSDEIPLESLGAFIAIVSSASKEAATLLINRFTPKRTVDFRVIVERQLAELFHEQLRRSHPVRGADKVHKFDYVVQLSGDRQLVLDLVNPNSNSINSAVVAHLDVKRAEREKTLQRIVYSPDDEWSSADLSLLALGAPPITYTALPNFLRKVA